MVPDAKSESTSSSQQANTLERYKLNEQEKRQERTAEATAEDENGNMSRDLHRMVAQDLEKGLEDDISKMVVEMDEMGIDVTERDARVLKEKLADVRKRKQFQVLSWAGTCQPKLDRERAFTLISQNHRDRFVSIRLRWVAGGRIWRLWM